jgi:hypothetical protein
MSDCPQCEGTGWRPIEREGVRSMEVCPCRRGGFKTRPDSKPLSPHFQSLGEIAAASPLMQKMLTPKDRDIAEIIARRRGAAQAISIEEITRELLTGKGESEVGSRESVAKLWERSIKDSVRRLRRAGMKVGACRGSRDGKKAVGYYVISTAGELRATVRPMLRQAIDELKTIEALTGHGFYTRELEGQARLEFQEQEIGSGK